MRKYAFAGAIALAFISAVAIAAPPYTRNTGGTTSDGILDALTDIYNRLGSSAGGSAGTAPAATRVTCTTAGTVVVTTADATKNVQSARNISAVSVWLGQSGISSTTGLEWKSGEPWDFSNLRTGSVYCATASGTADLALLKY